MLTLASYISGRGWDFDRQNNSDPSSFVTPYDYSSIMHYGDGFASKNDEKTLVPTKEGVRQEFPSILLPAKYRGRLRRSSQGGRKR